MADGSGRQKGRDGLTLTGLSTADLSATPLRRMHLVPEAARDAAYMAAYDCTTLWYDAFWREGHVILVAPLLLNLWPALKRAEWHLDGVPANGLRRSRFYRHEVLRIPAATPPRRISVTGADWSVETALSPTALDRFQGRNAIVTISKDNDLDWIRDFAQFHRRTQGAEAILFIDNGSTRYAAEEIDDTLADTGVDAMVVSAPRPYGPVVKLARSRHRVKFFRTAMLNLARLRFLSTARAVLNVDIDELVWSEGGSVFDMAARNWFGLATFTGVWRDPAPDLNRRPRHADHVWERDSANPSPVKYAIAPGKLAGRFSWDVHRLEGWPLRSPFLRQDAGYWHCSAISTGWKYKSRLDREGGDRIDGHFAQVLRGALPDPTVGPEAQNGGIG